MDPNPASTERMFQDRAFLERYELADLIASGGFGRVYRARQRTTGQDVAVKVLCARERSTQGESRARFRRELAVCASLHHPNIVRLIDSYQVAANEVLAVFELIPGSTLAEVIAAEGALAPAEAVHLMTQVLDGIACAHGAGIVHRDLKPANVMVTSTGARRNALVLDFGLGTFYENVFAERERLTEGGAFVGTPAYAAPEQLRGEDAKPNSDLFAWGLMLAECLTGRPVFDGSMAQMIQRQLDAEPIPIPQVLAGHALGELIAWVTQKDATRRPSRASDVLETLESIAACGLPEHADLLRVRDAGTHLLKLPTPALNQARAETLDQPRTLALPVKPSIAVLPFTNMSADPEQEYFSDGMTEDLITALSKISELFVISRHSVFTYKTKPVSVEQVGRDLGVRYVVAGGVRKVGTRVRITAQLVEGATGGHLWAERYDRELTDIFSLQDEIVEKIVFALRVTLSPEEQVRLRRAPTANLEAYDAYLRGVACLGRQTQEAIAQARSLFEHAIVLDPQYAAAYADLGVADWLAWTWQWSPDPQTLERAFAMSQRAVVLDASLPVAHRVLSFFYLWRDRDHGAAVAAAERALALDPNDSSNYFALAEVLNFAGSPEQALEMLKKAMRLDPRYPPVYLMELGFTYNLMGRHEEAIAASKSCIARDPDFLAAHLQLAFAYSERGEEEKARDAASEVLRLSPNFSLDVDRQRDCTNDPARADRWYATLRRAGLK